MSWQPAVEPECTGAECDPVQVVVTPKPHDLGGFFVRRALPSADARSVGPFVFFDQMGPADFPPGAGISVRPHPHIGIATITYLFEGEIMHSDSLGYKQAILPGEVNWMTCGSGIVHAERTRDEIWNSNSRLFGIQSWIALPQEHEETDPGFYHHKATELPTFAGVGVETRLIIGEMWGEASPVKTFSRMFYAASEMDVSACLELPNEHEERALYVAEGEIEIAGKTFADGNMLVLKEGVDATVTANQTSKVMLLGGDKLDGHRHMFWNFVSSRKERIEQAKDDWKNDRFAKVPGDDEFIPLPD